MGWDGVGCVGMGWDWLRWVGMGWDGLGLVAMCWVGMGWDALGWVFIQLCYCRDGGRMKWYGRQYMNFINLLLW